MKRHTSLVEVGDFIIVIASTCFGRWRNPKALTETQYNDLRHGNVGFGDTYFEVCGIQSLENRINIRQVQLDGWALKGDFAMSPTRTVAEDCT